MVDKPKQSRYTWLINQVKGVEKLKIIAQCHVRHIDRRKEAAFMTATDKNVTMVHEEDKDFIRSVMSLPQNKKILIQGIIIGLDLQEKQAETAVG